MSFFLDHVNSVLLKLRQDTVTSPSTDTTTVAYRVQIAVQRAIARVWNAKQWTFKQRKTNLSLVNGTSEYNLPKTVGEPYIVLTQDSNSNIRLCYPKTEEEFDTLIPNPIATGQPDMYILFDNRGVEAQPTSASTITVVSSSNTDITGKVFIRGIVNGQEDLEDVTLNGTTSVTTTKSFSEVYAISKDIITTGRITITSNGGAVTLLTLGRLETTIRLKRIRFYPKPNAAYTAIIKHFATPFIPEGYGEDSQIPKRWDYVVEQFAFAWALQPQGQDQLAEQQVQLELAEKYLNEDMASEEKQSSAVVVVPRKAFADTPYPYGYLRNAEDGFSFEIY